MPKDAEILRKVHKHAIANIKIVAGTGWHSGRSVICTLWHEKRINKISRVR
jgi:hypothetical protein